ncbi:MAG: lipopolysaccharide core biosynthesis protein LpsA [Campylobacteraceae bacterium]|nr:lipopolysaccharide core biosynthesis protein LpsA [Campylobacteraceae bacterium]
MRNFRYKINKLFYWIRSAFRYYICPKFITQKSLNVILSSRDAESEYIADRVGYYNKLDSNQLSENEAVLLRDFKYEGKKSSFFFDTYEYTRYFPDTLKMAFEFGDTVVVPPHCRIVKSRPIEGQNANSVLLNLDKIRHFIFVNDTINWADKEDRLIGRGGIYQSHRIKFYEKYFNSSLCDLGAVNKNAKDPRWVTKAISIKAHLKYKFILCLEGNDVASNLKWVMSSNSLAVMSRPKYETWFMEGKLIPNVHYVEIKPDFSDLEERLHFYINNPEEALKIIKNAHLFTQQFANKNREDLISLMVLQKYFQKTHQL